LVVREQRREAPAETGIAAIQETGTMFEAATLSPQGPAWLRCACSALPTALFAAGSFLQQCADRP
jgi:hypothetical protein